MDDEWAEPGSVFRPSDALVGSGGTDDPPAARADMFADALFASESDGALSPPLPTRTDTSPTVSSASNPRYAEAIARPPVGPAPIPASRTSSRAAVPARRGAPAAASRPTRALIAPPTAPPPGTWIPRRAVPVSAVPRAGTGPLLNQVAAGRIGLTATTARTPGATPSAIRPALPPVGRRPISPTAPPAKRMVSPRAQPAKRTVGRVRGAVSALVVLLVLLGSSGVGRHFLQFLEQLLQRR